MAVTNAVGESPGAATVLSLSHRGRGLSAPGAVRVRIGTWSIVAGSMLIPSSLTYLARQQLPAAVTVASPLGDFALEGVALALSWLGAMLTAGLGAEAVRSPHARSGPRRAHGAAPG